jgi:hypothetical protein
MDNYRKGNIILNKIIEKRLIKLRESVFGDKSEYGIDGYHEFTGPMEDYDLDKARENVYGSVKPKPYKIANQPFVMTKKQREQLPFGTLDKLDTMLSKLPVTTQKIIIFSPYHAYYQSPTRSRNGIVWQECKKRTATLASKYQNTYVLDFMIKSPITREDSNYWDHKHYTVKVAEELGFIIGNAVHKKTKNPNYRLLYPKNNSSTVQ